MTTSYDHVVSTITTRFGVPAAEITLDASFDDLGLDSLAQIELATALQKRLSVEIEDDEIAEVSTVRELVAQLDKKQVPA
jgi:acyl carrier protein